MFSKLITALAMLTPIALCAIPASAQPDADPASPWPAEVADHQPVAPGEHPRLFFRESDLPELRAFAKTPAGLQMIARLQEQLGGDMLTEPASAYNDVTEAYGKGGPKLRGSEWPDGTFSISHPAGYGFLYQLTDDESYARLGIQSFEKLLEGQRDRDREGRYSFRNPGGALRAGPSLGWTALGYDLLYDAMSPEQRQKYARAIESYDEGQWTSLEELARGARHNPGSNHWGMQVGGAGLALLAIKGDPELENPDRIEKLLQENRKAMIRNVTEGFGDHGWYAEGDGTGVMASHIIYLPALQAYREVEGLDYTSPRPNARWPVLKFIHMSYPQGDKQPGFPKRGAYPHNVWATEAMTGPGTFRSGFAIVAPEERPALMWLYNRTQGFVGPYETGNPYPHNTILAFVNWPRPGQPGAEEADPGSILPHAFRDEKNGFYATRNRWQDENDVLVTLQTRATRGLHKADKEAGQLWVWGMGQRLQFGTMKGEVADYQAADDGSMLLTMDNGTSLAVDFSKTSGADALLATTGPGAKAANPKGDHLAAQTLQLAGQDVHLLMLSESGEHPKAVVQGDAIHVNGQQITIEDGQLQLSKM